MGLGADSACTTTRRSDRLTPHGIALLRNSSAQPYRPPISIPSILSDSTYQPRSHLSLRRKHHPLPISHRPPHPDLRPMSSISEE